MDNKYIKIIKGTPLFQGMSDEEIAQFLRPDGSGIKSFRKESYIFHAGDKTAYFGILLEGKALIERDEALGWQEHNRSFRGRTAFRRGLCLHR